MTEAGSSDCNSYKRSVMRHEPLCLTRGQKAQASLSRLDRRRFMGGLLASVVASAVPLPVGMTSELVEVKLTSFTEREVIARYTLKMAYHALNYDASSQFLRGMMVNGVEWKLERDDETVSLLKFSGDNRK